MDNIHSEVIEKECIFAKNCNVMKTAAKNTEKTISKTTKKVVVPPKKRGGYGFLKGKIHYDNSVFNLGK